FDGPNPSSPTRTPRKLFGAVFVSNAVNLANSLQGLFYARKKRGFALKYSRYVQKCIYNVGENNGKSYSE
ncbi:hypothetical protein, partial [Ruminococcus flavefaciens]|uniref:hypothetical protein n=1 Tax=Ruminococcus flavefaciens TaxID=1265 RepID=UPI0026ECD7A2